MSDGLLEAIERAVGEALVTTLPGAIDRLAEIAGPRAYSIPQVAGRLDLSESTVRKLIHDGHLRTVPHLNPARVAASTLDDFLAREETA